MADAAWYRALIFGVLSLFGAASWAEEKAAIVPPTVSAPATASGGGNHGFDSAGTVSLLGYVLTLVVLGAAGVTVLLKGGLFGVSWGASKTVRKLHIEESRTVGNRQHLAVVEYEGRRVLLGISPGRIDFLCALESDASGQGAVFSEALSDAAALSAQSPKAAHVEGVAKEVL